MNSMTPRNSSPTAELALLTALCMLIVLSTAQFAGAQQQSSISVAPVRTARDALDYLSLITPSVGIIVGLVAAIMTVRWSILNWKRTYFTKEWSTLMQFVQPQARFMDPALTTNYKSSFVGDDAMKYEMIARLCIGYLDDLYFLGSKDEIHTWFRGSVKLLVGTHRKWLEDHHDSYDQGFYNFILSELNR